MPGRNRALLGLAVALAVSGCTAIFGWEEGKPYPPGAGTSGAGTSGAGTSGASGESGTGGTDSGGTGGSAGIVVEALPQHVVERVDILFMVDNSVSMADKQALLAKAVPTFVRRLVDPVCIDGAGKPTSDASSADGCDEGIPEFHAVRDLHVGVVTSSLGTHGGTICAPDPNDTTQRPLNDKAQLLGSLRSLYSYADSGFLVWDPRTGSERPTPDPHPGRTVHETSVGDFVTDFANHVSSASELGCGFEAQLEAWYRFLVDPEPVTQTTNNGQVGVRGAVNDVVLEQRRAFLRPDSLLAIVMLTDENDCSLLDEDGAQSWLATSRTPMPRGAEACSHPGDPDQYRCCVPCALITSPGATPEGCNYDGDAACAAGPQLTPSEDSTNVRCFNQKARFGVDFLYPTERYVDGLREAFVDGRDGNPVRNPIYAPGDDGTPARDPSQVVFAGILGVPWQDLATEESWSGSGLTYLSADELVARDRWRVILGDPVTGQAPFDPHMIESIDERVSGVQHPLLGNIAAIASSSSVGRPDPISGHEQNVVSRDDLQYACTFRLDLPVPCNAANQDGCDCNASEAAYHRSLCDYPTAGAEGSQLYAKAYPAVRELTVLKEFGSNAVVTSICPKNLSVPEDGPSYGYTPALNAILRGFTGSLAPGCLTRPLEPDETGALDCRVVEARRATDCSCDAGTGRGALESGDASVSDAVESTLVARGICGGQTDTPCEDLCLCEILELRGGELDTCLTSPVNTGNLDGFCYVDATSGNPALVADCPPSRRQRIRFMGGAVPAPGSSTFVVCG